MTGTKKRVADIAALLQISVVMVLMIISKKCTNYFKTSIDSTHIGPMLGSVLHLLFPPKKGYYSILNICYLPAT